MLELFDGPPNDVTEEEEPKKLLSSTEQFPGLKENTKKCYDTQYPLLISQIETIQYLGTTSCRLNFGYMMIVINSICIIIKYVIFVFF